MFRAEFDRTIVKLVNAAVSREAQNHARPKEKSKKEWAYQFECDTLGLGATDLNVKKDTRTLYGRWLARDNSCARRSADPAVEVQGQQRGSWQEGEEEDNVILTL